jgi:hypothetical protein
MKDPECKAAGANIQGRTEYQNYRLGNVLGLPTRKRSSGVTEFRDGSILNLGVYWVVCVHEIRRSGRMTIRI